ncbi:hypothetical protein HYFRA_00008430 [Hymenoscyphus fraxineus]|uniref:Uncharacterized protein n=1 Tax=Hymenoscyphus fraxineus TaxID=746836 RepID=A0A9N9KNH4_9HELO|nr:hypothetical protein HYFRA_00008430 [Hymenoscyphus fraxineus]
MARPHSTSPNNGDAYEMRISDEPQPLHVELEIAQEFRSINQRLAERFRDLEEKVLLHRKETSAKASRDVTLIELERYFGDDKNEGLAHENEELRREIDRLVAEGKKHLDTFRELEGEYKHSQHLLTISAEKHNNLLHAAKTRERELGKEAESVAREMEDLKNGNQSLVSQNRALQENVRKLRDVISSRSKEKEFMRKSKDIAMEMDGLRSRNQLLVSQIEALQENSKELKGIILRGSKENESGKISEYTAKEIEDLKTSNQSLESQIKVLQENSKNLRRIILSKSKEKGEEIDDGTITATFYRLRDTIQRVIQRYYLFDATDRPSRSTSKTPRYIRDLLDYWAHGPTKEQLGMRVRAMIFQIINSEILKKPHFGLESGSFSEMELQLARFEMALLEYAPKSEKEIVEWRVQTVKCASLLKSDQPQPQSLKVAAAIWDSMDPFMRREYTDKNGFGSQLHTNPWEEVCDAAARFTLLVRKSRDGYKCEMPRPGTEISEKEMSIQYMEKGEFENVEDSAVVSFAISGALVKYPEYSVIERLVLEKAYVVARQRSSPV